MLFIIYPFLFEMVIKLILVLKRIKGHGEIRRKFMYFRTCFKHVSSCLRRDDITAPKWGGLVTWETLFLLWSAAVHQQGWPHLQLKRFDLCPFGLVKQGKKILHRLKNLKQTSFSFAEFIRLVLVQMLRLHDVEAIKERTVRSLGVRADSLAFPSHTRKICFAFSNSKR